MNYDVTGTKRFTKRGTRTMENCQPPLSATSIVDVGEREVPNLILLESSSDILRARIRLVALTSGCIIISFLKLLTLEYSIACINTRWL